jgi:hypothetical protein
MPFLKRQDIDLALRAKHDKEWKTKLKQALINPALTAEERRHIQEQLDMVGKPKVYRADTPPKLGAISFTEEKEE